MAVVSFSSLFNIDISAGEWTGAWPGHVTNHLGTHTRKRPNPPHTHTPNAGEKASYAIKYMVFASRRAVFEALTNKREVSRYTRGAAESEPVPGGKYEVFDGNVVGTYVAAAEVRGCWALG